ncbi:MAG: hypothetical protein KZQ70_10990 [gamma proteobacterium symbiont of Lucinoma myriamae]|nr:hypothetical protein [gamma proteobacterium symbiont of Lucinoma myriamae]
MIKTPKNSMKFIINEVMVGGWQNGGGWGKKTLKIINMIEMSNIVYLTCNIDSCECFV